MLRLCIACCLHMTELSKLNIQIACNGIHRTREKMKILMNRAMMLKLCIACCLHMTKLSELNIQISCNGIQRTQERNRGRLRICSLPLSITYGYKKYTIWSNKWIQGHLKHNLSLALPYTYVLKMEKTVKKLQQIYDQINIYFCNDICYS